MNHCEILNSNCCVCGAKHSTINVIEQKDDFLYVYQECSECCSQYSGKDEFKLMKLLNKTTSKGELLND